MKNIIVQQINAFSIEGKGGNPAGVVFNADDLTHEQKQFIAAEAGFPETAFVSRSAVADFKLEFFTPIKQIPHCGHATVAVFSFLKQQGEIIREESSKETIDGNRSIFFRNGKAFMEQRAPIYSFPEEDHDSILQSLGLREEDLLPEHKPVIVNTGNSFLIVPLHSADALQRIRPDLKLISELSKKYSLVGFYPFTTQTASAETDAAARMFAPYYGINEEAATGMAAGPLACYLFSSGLVKNDSITIEQGQFMKIPSASLIFAELEIQNGNIQKVFTGGSAYVSKTVEIKLNYYVIHKEKHSCHQWF